MRKVWSPLMEIALDALDYEESMIQYAKLYPSITPSMLVEVYHDPWTCAGYGRVTEVKWCEKSRDHLCRVEMFWSSGYYPSIPAHKLKRIEFPSFIVRKSLLQVVK